MYVLSRLDFQSGIVDYSAACDKPFFTFDRPAVDQNFSPVSSPGLGSNPKFNLNLFHPYDASGKLCFTSFHVYNMSEDLDRPTVPMLLEWVTLYPSHFKELMRILSLVDLSSSDFISL